MDDEQQLVDMAMRVAEANEHVRLGQALDDLCEQRAKALCALQDAQVKLRQFHSSDPQHAYYLHIIELRRAKYDDLTRAVVIARKEVAARNRAWNARRRAKKKE